MKDYAKKFYKSKEWKKCRDSYFKYKLGICERCGANGDIVHHKNYIHPGNINNPEVTLNWENLEVLCQKCHNKEHFEKYSWTREGLIFNAAGDLIEKNNEE